MTEILLLIGAMVLVVVLIFGAGILATFWIFRSGSPRRHRR